MADDREGAPDALGADNPDTRFSRSVGRKALRKQLARRTADRGPWFWLGMFGLVGWSIAAPTVLGIALGVWLDHRFPGRLSWTLTLLSLGVLLGCLNAWNWVRQENRHE